MPRLVALSNQWRRQPPVHELVAAYLGYKPPKEQTVNDPLEIEKLAQLFGASGI